ncbi:Secretory lipase [Corynebacterium capitovis DSM 44611]|uniref:lipase family protein n=1 Tax=Corynebacterium capitovis TaxID=131081 RepID=UPI000380CF3C|nr:lipase family protein [Corynebacterium capitovis]WKD58187.1 Secretory lipase [Corynebacterium capitovis DSM 44611]
MNTDTEWFEVPSDTVPAAPRGAATYRVRYVAPGARGDVPMTGLVTVPDTPRSDGAILSWAHGTTGLSTGSAPSLHTAGDPIERYIPHWTAYLQRWLDDGFIITQPDYEGLGVDGVPATYMHRGSLASSITRLVEETTAQFSTDGTWVNTGFSQGGYASLAASDSPAEGLAATISIAPGDTELVNKNLRRMGIRPVDVAKMLKGRAVRFFPLVIAGAQNAFEDVDASEFLSERGAELVRKAEELTLPELGDEVHDTSGGELFLSQASTKHMQDQLDEQRLELMTPQGPVYIVAGTEDTTVNRESIKSNVKTWASRGVSVQYAEVADSNHNTSVANSYEMQRDWLKAYVG